jgi:hypothetical protein
MLSNSEEEINNFLENKNHYEDENNREYYSDKNIFIFNNFKITKEEDYDNECEDIRDNNYCVKNIFAFNNLEITKEKVQENFDEEIYFIKKPLTEILFEKNQIKCGLEKINSMTKANTNSKSSFKKPAKIQEKIFNIMKINKKVGRLMKKMKNSIKAKHNKLSEDNIIQKIKVSFLEKIFNKINYEYEKFLLEGKSYNDNKQKNIVKLIKRISPQESKKIKKEDNLNWFSLKLKVLLSSNLSLKYSKFTPNYNEKRIKNLYEKKEAINVIEILEKSVRDMYEKYSNNIKIDGFGTLEDDLISIRKKMENNGEENIDEYLNEYRKIAQNLENIFKAKKSRVSKNKENLIKKK